MSSVLSTFPVISMVCKYWTQEIPRCGIMPTLLGCLLLINWNLIDRIRFTVPFTPKINVKPDQINHLPVTFSPKPEVRFLRSFCMSHDVSGVKYRMKAEVYLLSEKMNCINNCTESQPVCDITGRITCPGNTPRIGFVVIRQTTLR